MYLSNWPAGSKFPIIVLSSSCCIWKLGYSTYRVFEYNGEFTMIGIVTGYVFKGVRIAKSVILFNAAKKINNNKEVPYLRRPWGR